MNGIFHVVNVSLLVYLLFREAFSNGSLTGSVRFLCLLNLVPLDVSSADQHTHEGTQTKVIVRLIGQLLITQPENHRESKFLIHVHVHVYQDHTIKT